MTYLQNVFTMIIVFEWDELKNQRNIAERGLDFADAVKLFRETTVISEDARKDYGEQRFVAAGILEEQLVIIVYTWRSENRIRIISFRKANKRERRNYEKKIEN